MDIVKVDQALYHNERAEIYDIQMNSTYWRAYNKLTIEKWITKINKGDLVLDLGCGTGRCTIHVAVAGEIIEHIFYPEKFLGKVIKVLKKDGIFIGSTPNAFNIKNRLRFLLGKTEGTTLEDEMHINHFSYNKLNLILKSYFNEVKIYPLVGRRYSLLASIKPSLFAHTFVWYCKQPKKS